MSTFNVIYTNWAPSVVTMPECDSGACSVTVAPAGPATPYLFFEIWPETYDTVAVEVEIEETVVLSETVTADPSEGPFAATID